MVTGGRVKLIVTDEGAVSIVTGGRVNLFFDNEAMIIYINWLNICCVVCVGQGYLVYLIRAPLSFVLVLLIVY